MATLCRRAFLGALAAGLARSASASATPAGVCIVTDGDRLSAGLRALAEERGARGWRVAHLALCPLEEVGRFLRTDLERPLLLVVRVAPGELAHARRDLSALLARHEAARRVGMHVCCIAP